MLLMVVDVENVLLEFHHTPTASEGECRGRLLRELRSDFGDEVQRLTLMIGRIHLWNSRSNTKLVLQTRDYSYVKGVRLELDIERLSSTQKIIQINLTEHGAQGRLRQLRGCVKVILDFHDGPWRIHNAEIKIAFTLKETLPREMMPWGSTSSVTVRRLIRTIL